MYEECNGAEKYYFYDSNGVISGIRYFDAKGNMTMIYVVTNALGDVIALYDKNGNAVVEYQYDAWGNIISIKNGDGTALSSDAVAWNEINPFRYRGYYYDSETELYYLQSRYYDAEVGRFINADNNFSNYNLFMYCGNNSVSRIDPNGEHWYYLGIDDLLKAVDELMASVSNIVYGREAYKRSYYDLKGAIDLWRSRPFQNTKPSQEIQNFAKFMYDHDFVADISVSVGTPIKNMYIKFGASRVLSPSKNITASYVHAGVGVSTPSVLPITISYSVGIVSGVKTKYSYAKSFNDRGTGAILGFDYSWWENGASAYSFTVSNSYGMYGGYDYYWCID